MREGGEGVGGVGPGAEAGGAWVGRGGGLVGWLGGGLGLGGIYMIGRAVNMPMCNV